ncbi:MAG: hypothetical protein C0519_10115 [Hyphomicrobium sp.]|nr:hypothetical protein [Hyphomicrobium sp.]PPD08370.1 MAG: hypothetical protein CTY28_06115 [Hyphomicrobium sp.]
MTSALIGLAIGFGVGLFGFVAIRRLADKIVLARPDEAGQRTVALLRSTAVLDLILFTAGGALVGYFFFPSG